VTKDACTDSDVTCESCGNGTCDEKESESSCPSDCVKTSDWPYISYSKSEPKDGSKVSSPVIATVVMPDACKIVNNNNSPSYTFKYNGFYIFQVSCPRFEKEWSLGTKVYRIE
jgi:hypothetical protein